MCSHAQRNLGCICTDDPAANDDDLSLLYAGSYNFV